MAYYTQEELEQIGFKSLGRDIKISTKASIYAPEKMKIGDNVRIDDFCILSGNIKLGSHIHIAPYCLLAGGIAGINMGDFSGLAYGVKLFTATDDYSGETLFSPVIPIKYRTNTVNKPIIIERYSIIGASSTICTGVTISEGTSIGAMSCITKDTKPWGLYIGNPARRVRTKSNKIIEQSKQFLKEYYNTEND